MYNKRTTQKTSINRNTSYQGERLEEKIMRIMNNKEPIKDGAPLIYTDREEGVRPDMNIRSDRFDIAIDAMDVVTSTHKAKRADRAEKEKSIGEEAKDNMGKEREGKA